MYTPEPEIIHYGGQTTKRMFDEFLLQLHGAKLIFIKKHRSKMSFFLARYLMSLFFFLRVSYWFSLGLFCNNERERSMLTAKNYLKAGFYCIVDWKNLLMNKDVVSHEL